MAETRSATSTNGVGADDQHVEGESQVYTPSDQIVEQAENLRAMIRPVIHDVQEHLP